MPWETPKNDIKIEPSFGDQDDVGQPGEIKEWRGRRFRWQDSGYSLRQYYSHETPEKGPGPGWDSRRDVLTKYKVTEPSELPDDVRVYSWEEIFDDEKE